MPHVMCHQQTSKPVKQTQRVCPASGLKYREVIISRAHYDNTNHTISSSELEPDDLNHVRDSALLINTLYEFNNEAFLTAWG